MRNGKFVPVVCSILYVVILVVSTFTGKKLSPKNFCLTFSFTHLKVLSGRLLYVSHVKIHWFEFLKKDNDCLKIWYIYVVKFLNYVVHELFNYEIKEVNM